MHSSDMLFKLRNARHMRQMRDRSAAIQTLLDGVSGKFRHPRDETGCMTSFRNASCLC